MTDLDVLIAQVAAAHASCNRARWAVAHELLGAAVHLFDPDRHIDLHDLRNLLAGIGALAVRAQVPTVPLFTSRAGDSVAGLSVPSGLRRRGQDGPPEEDAFRLAVISAARRPSHAWLGVDIDDAALRHVMRLIIGRLTCRLNVLSAVAALHLLDSLAAANATERRWLIRRLAWLVDHRVDDATEFMSALLGSDDPLVRVRSPRTTTTARSTETFPFAGWSRWPEAGSLALAGRINAVRRHGATTFADLVWDGLKAQMSMPTTASRDIRRGDLIAVSGIVGTSRTGEPTLFADRVLRHEPATVAEPPTDALSSQVQISDLLARVRPSLAAEGFREAMTPVLTATAFGGASRPFTSWSAATGETAYLRVTSELALVGLLARGWQRCYEIGPSFRNERLRGEGPKEFSMLEAYAVDLDLAEMVELVAGMVTTTLGDTGTSLRRLSFDEAFHELSGVDATDSPGVRRLARRLTPATADRTDDVNTLARRLWRAAFRHRLAGRLVAIHSIPGDGSPFISGQGRNAQRVWLYVDGTEVAEVARNELDEASVRDRLDRLRQDQYAIHRDYTAVLDTLAYGVPPCVGVGLGVTRLARLRSHASLEEGNRQ